LLYQYGHNNLTSYFKKVEDVFISEIASREEIACDMVADNVDVSDFLTTIDLSMQKQAFLTGEIWVEISKILDVDDRQEIIDIVGDIWYINYSVSLPLMQNAIFALEALPNTENVVNKIKEIIVEIKYLI
jgi:hypothetical protein